MKTKTKVAEFDIKDILPIVLIIVVAGIGAAFGLQVTGDIKADMVTDTTGCGLNSTGGTSGTLLYTNCGADYNATEDTQTGVANITSKFGIVGSVIAAAIILGILVRYLYNMFA